MHESLNYPAPRKKRPEANRAEQIGRIKHNLLLRGSKVKKDKYVNQGLVSTVYGAISYGEEIDSAELPEKSRIYEISPISGISKLNVTYIPRGIINREYDRQINQGVTVFSTDKSISGRMIEKGQEDIPLTLDQSILVAATVLSELRNQIALREIEQSRVDDSTLNHFLAS